MWKVTIAYEFERHTGLSGWKQVNFPGPPIRLLAFGLYFQDYFPNNPGYKVHLNAFYGTGLPLSSPNDDQYYTKLRMRPYRRVDIGFSKVIKRED